MEKKVKKNIYVLLYSNFVVWSQYGVSIYMYICCAIDDIFLQSLYLTVPKKTVVVDKIF